MDLSLLQIIASKLWRRLIFKLDFSLGVDYAISEFLFSYWINFMLIIMPSATTLDTFIKHSGRLISGSNLYLHEICFVMWTFRTNYGGLSSIFPCCCSSQNVINLFLRQFYGFGYSLLYFKLIWTGFAYKKHSSRLIARHQKVSTCRAKQHFL